jgi:hypothetical protein
MSKQPRRSGESWNRRVVQKFSGDSRGHFSDTAVIDHVRVDYGFADNSPRMPVVAVCLNGAASIEIIWTGRCGSYSVQGDIPPCKGVL